ncbi:hypothetical protein WJX72_004842 [[Myrmecia] bisecta]|uniref:Kinesin motor domain-containing protein n=1 Tax=[Myrmecia] bisecta TaxID=41462 RepID=A0AAW1PG70_9CHLO
MQQILSAFKRSSKKKRLSDTDSLVENMQENVPMADENSSSHNDTPLKPTKLLGVLGSSTSSSGSKAPATHSKRPPSAAVLRPSNLQPLVVPDPAGTPLASKPRPGRPGSAARTLPNKANSFSATPGRTPSRNRFEREQALASPHTPMTPSAGALSALGSARKQRTPRPLSASLDGFRAAQLLQQHQQQAASGSGDNVKVVVRVRPLNAREAELGSTVCVQLINGQNLKLLTTPQPHFYTFDAVAGEGVDQNGIFTVAGRPIVDNCILGYNSCIFAYGQTGSGKTWTMLGPVPDTETSFSELQADHELRGLIPRVFEDMFARILQEQEQAPEGETIVYTCKCSFLEIYNENITDLLSPSDVHLHIREDAKHGVYVENLFEEVVTSASDTARLLAAGAATRRVGQTHMNRESSRSHSVFTCSLEKKTTDGSGLTNLLFSRLNLVDLAGSELQRQSGAMGERLKEASSINKSLSTLGRVIMSLVEAQHGQQRHIPYRDSRLTFLLQDSLGGNSKTFMIANISPAAVNIAETMSTLGFAQRAKRIKNKAVINEDMSGDTHLLRLEIQRLKEEMGRMRAQGQAHADFCSLPRAAHPVSPLAAWGSPAHPSYHTQTDHAALMGALRREEVAVKQAQRLQSELAATHELLKEREMDIQRTKMIIRLKDGRVLRLEAAVRGLGLMPEAELDALRQENDLLRAKVENHPEVKRFAVENLHLSAELARMQELVAAGELEALVAEVDTLRSQVLSLAEQAQRLSSTPKVKEVEAAAARAAAQNSAQIEAAMAQAEDVRRKSTAEIEAQALEVVELRDRLKDEEEAAREYRGKLAEAHAVIHHLEAQKLGLEEKLAQMRGECLELRSQLSPMRTHNLRVSELGAALRAAEEAAAASQEEVRTLRLMHDDQLAMAKAELTLRERAEANIEELRAELAAAEKQQVWLQATSHRQAEELAASLDKVAMLKAAIKDTTAQVMESEQRRHQEEVEALKEELQAQCSISLQTQADLEAATVELAAARLEAEQVAGEMRAMQAKLWEAQATVESKHSEVLGAHAAAKEHLSCGELARVEAQREAAEQAAATAARADAVHLQDLVQQLETQTAMLQQKMAAQAAEHEQALASAHARSVTFCEREFAALREQLDAERQREVAGLQQELQAQAAQHEALQDQMEATSRLLATLQVEAGEQRQQAQRALQEKTAEAEALRHAMASLQSARAHEASAIQEASAEAHRATITASEAQARIDSLISEREAWMAELMEQRASANAAMDAADALEARVRQLQEAEEKLSAQLTEAKQKEAVLELEVTKLTGQHNHHQRVQHHLKVKEESNTLKAELTKLRDEHAKTSLRYSRAMAELGRYRSQAGKEAAPDLDEEDRLRTSLATLEAEKLRLTRDFEALAQAVLGLAAIQGTWAAATTSPGSEGTDTAAFAESGPRALGGTDEQAAGQSSGGVEAVQLCPAIQVDA